MLLDYVIIKSSEIKRTKGAFTYYIITEGGGVPNMPIHDCGDGGEGGVGLVMT